MGGFTTGAVVTSDKVTYSSDVTSATATANLSSARYAAAGVSGTLAGYAMGGTTGTAVATSDKVTHATSVSSVIGSLAIASYGQAAIYANT
jgi:hypothetical protein